MANSGERMANSPAAQDIESLKAAHSALATSNNCMPLLFGRFEVAPQRLLNAILVGYTAFFLVHRLADAIYFLTIDAAFPKGLEWLYKSEAERLRAISYTRQNVAVSMLCQTLIFLVVVALVQTKALVFVDESLGRLLKQIEACFGSCPSVFRVVGRCCSGFSSWFSAALFSHCCCGFQPKWGTAVRGAAFLTLASALFYVLQAPFQLWMYHINVEFGFSNVITMAPAAFRANLMLGLLQKLMTSAPPFFLYLLVLQCRFGWLLLWGGMIVTSTLAQYRMGAMAPMIFNGVFPDSDFAVARGFPVVPSTNASHPWVSLNRIYYENKDTGTFMTQDSSKGPVELAEVKSKNGKAEEWVFRDMDAGSDAEPYAETVAEVERHQTSGNDVERLSKKTWELGGEPNLNAHIGLRHGGKLRRSLFRFARDHGINVGDVYMVDGSYQDARANAFVAGAGEDRAIGLYDTLFLGNRAPFAKPDVEGGASGGAAGGAAASMGGALRSLLLAGSSQTNGGQSGEEELGSRVSIQHLSEALRAADASEGRPPASWRNAPARAMSDAEILAILGHELGHSALRHVERGMVVQGVSSFATFALLGWMVHSPLLAAGFSLTAPLGHMAVFAYNHLAGATFDGVTSIVTNAITRSNEYAADAYSARVSKKYAKGLQTALAKLTVSSSQDPGEPWFYEALHSDHPSFARRWAAIAKIQDQLYEDASEVEDQ